MYVKNRFRAGKPYFFVGRKGTALDIAEPPEIWLCESGISKDCTRDGCSRCGVDLIFVRMSRGRHSMSNQDKVQFVNERDAARELMTWDEYVDACLFTCRGTQSDASAHSSPPAPGNDSPPRSAVVGREKSTFQDLLGQCEGQSVERVSIIGAKSSGFADACRLVPGMSRLRLDSTPLSCAEMAPISKAPSLKVLDIITCPIVRSHTGTNDRLMEDIDAEPHECSGRTCLTRSFQHLARRLTGLFCVDVKIRDQDIWGFDSGSSIECLMLTGSKITDQSAPRFGAMRELRSVNLSDSRISDEVVIALCRNNPIEAIVLDRTRVSDRSVDHLIRAPKLRSLWIRGTNVSRDGLQRLRDEMPECRLHL